MPHRTQSNPRYSLEGLEAVMRDAREDPHFLDKIWGIFCSQYPEQAGALNRFATQETADSPDRNAKFRVILGTMILFATLNKSAQAEELKALLFPDSETPETVKELAPPMEQDVRPVISEGLNPPSDDGVGGDASAQQP